VIENKVKKFIFWLGLKKVSSVSRRRKAEEQRRPDAAKLMKPLSELNPGKLETQEAWSWWKIAVSLLLGIDQNAPEMFWGDRFRGGWCGGIGSGSPTVRRILGALGSSGIPRPW